MRLFTAVDVAPPILEAVRGQLEALRPVAPNAKWVDVSKLHLTLNFLGEQDEALLPKLEGVLSEVGAAHPPVTLRAIGGGRFGSAHKPKVLWLGVGGDVERLAQLQADLATRLKSLRLELEDRVYSPHLTLARARQLRGDPALAACVERLGPSSQLGEWTVSELVLYRSQTSPKGASYTALLRIPLTGPRS